jgi:hypothetical protein
MRIFKSLIVVGAVAGLAVAPALADTSTTLSTATSAATNTAASVGSTNGANFGQVMSSIQASKKDALQIQALTTIKNVNVIKVHDIAKGENKSALDVAMKKNKGDIASLRAALSSNTAVNAALAKANVDVSTVVAADVSGNAELTVYVL